MWGHLNSSGGSLLIFNDGSHYRGNIVNDFLICHKNDFNNLFFHWKEWSPKIISWLNNYYSFFRKGMENCCKIFKGVLTEGKKNGYCFLKYQDDSFYKGFFLND